MYPIAYKIVDGVIHEVFPGGESQPARTCDDGMVINRAAIALREVEMSIKRAIETHKDDPLTGNGKTPISRTPLSEFCKQFEVEM